MATPAAEVIRRRFFAPGQTLHAPHLLDLEVAQVLRRYFLSRVLSPERAQQALEFFTDLPLTRYQHSAFLPRIWELRQNLTAYDAAYVALAEALRATLITRDAALASSFGHTARIVLL